MSDLFFSLGSHPVEISPICYGEKNLQQAYLLRIANNRNSSVFSGRSVLLPGADIPGPPAVRPR